MNNKTLIKNATIVNEGASIISDILIEGHKIFSKYKSDRFPYEGEILELINKNL